MGYLFCFLSCSGRKLVSPVLSNGDLALYLKFETHFVKEMEGITHIIMLVASLFVQKPP
jgi:hypothetical protein